jgi:DNA-binding transcriptional LysR family regulator
MGESALLLSRVAAGQSLSLDGPVCISASEVISTYILPPILSDIHAKHPGIVLEVVATNQTSDLMRREADIALRNFRPQEADLVARKVRQDKGYLYATPEYLCSLENPRSLEELSRGDFLAFDHSDVFKSGLAKLGLHLSTSNFPWVTSSQAVQWAFITRGSGIGVMMDVVGDIDPRVVRVLPDQISFSFDTWLTSHREIRTSRRVRTVFDLLANALQNTDN